MLESFKLDIIDLASGVIRISSKCSCLEIFDQQGNLIITSLVVISYHLVSELALVLIPYHFVLEFFLGLIPYHLVSESSLEFIPYHLVSLHGHNNELSVS